MDIPWGQSGNVRCFNLTLVWKEEFSYARDRFGLGKVSARGKENLVEGRFYCAASGKFFEGESDTLNGYL